MFTAWFYLWISLACFHSLTPKGFVSHTCSLNFFTAWSGVSVFTLILKWPCVVDRHCLVNCFYVYSHPEMTLCGWQDIRHQVLTNCILSALEYRFVSMMWWGATCSLVCSFCCVAPLDQCIYIACAFFLSAGLFHSYGQRLRVPTGLEVCWEVRPWRPKGVE